MEYQSLSQKKNSCLQIAQVFLEVWDSSESQLRIGLNWKQAMENFKFRADDLPKEAKLCFANTGEKKTTKSSTKK